tara:strand:- start:3610 stop:3816 length:207 start_codon:yes stop_codon:yes gene_type:complete
MVLPESADVVTEGASCTHHMGHDADVAHIVSRLLQLYQLLRRDYRHLGCVVVRAAVEVSGRRDGGAAV